MLELLKLFLVFFLIGMFTFGGGYAMIMMMNDILVNLNWVTSKEMINFIAISESTPGPFAVNVASFVGYKMFGVGGAIIATLGAVIPSIIIISIIFRIYNKFLSNRFVNGALKGIRPVVIGLIISVGLSLMITNFADISGKISINYNVILISLLIFAIRLKYKKISPIFLIIIGAIMGMLLL